MAKRNERGAGRKPALSEKEIREIRKRKEQGEKLSALAKEYGVSRQTLSGHLNRDEQMENICRTIKKWQEYNHMFRDTQLLEYTMRMDYMWKEECCTVILVDFIREKIVVANTTDDIIHRAFGVQAKPTWTDFMEFLENRCFPKSRDHIKVILKDLELSSYDPLAIVEKTKGRMAEDFQWIKITYFEEKDGRKRVPC